MNFLSQTIKNIVKPAADFVSCTTEDTIGSVADSFQSSHDAILVYDANQPEKLAGLLINQLPAGKAPHPDTAKVGNFLVTPPRLNGDSVIVDILEAMLELRVSILPLRNEDDEVEGVVTVQDILHQLTEDKESLQLVASSINPRKPITAPMSSTVGEIASIMADHHISRVVLVSETNSLAGIVSRRDILDAYIAPSDRQRFGKLGNRSMSRSFDEEKAARVDQPVSTYATTKVETAADTRPLNQVIRPIIEGQTSSIVLVNEVNQPTGFISRRDLLEAMTSLQSQDSQPVIFKHTDMEVSAEDQQRLDEVAQNWANKITRSMPISQIVVSYEVAKTGEGRVREIETTVIVDPASGPSSDSLIAKTKSRSWLEGLREAIDILDSQLRRRRG